MSEPYSKYILEGRIVTMGPQGNYEDGAIYVHDGVIIDVLDEDADPPEGFEDAPHIRTGDTIYPGFIELHNHLCFNAMPYWQVNRQFSNSGQWKRLDAYRTRITKPTQVLGGTPGVVEALVRYVECRALFGGTTTTQGLRLYTETGIGAFFQGLVRNVEEAGNDELPRVGSKIANPSKNKAEKYLTTMNKFPCYLQHISEGTDDTARNWFRNLQIDDDEWAVNHRFCGIHATAFHEEDFAILSERGASVIWSPLSNFLLYGGTMNIEAAKEHDVLMGIGCDWAPSGSKNMLGELKVAWLVSEERGGVFSAEDLVKMATINSAKILKWDKALGSIEKGKKADFVAINGQKGDPYMHVIEARETSITLAVIDGIPRIGQKSLMKKFDLEEDELDQISIGKSARYLYLKQENIHPLVENLSYTEAHRRLSEAMQNLPQLAIEYDTRADNGILNGSIDGTGAVFRVLHDFEEEEPEFEDAAAPSAEYIKEPMELEDATVADNNIYLRYLVDSINLPEYVKKGLPPLYGMSVPAASSASFLEEQLAEETYLTVRPLRTLYRQDELNAAQRLQIINQALLLLEQHYVHLPFKKAMHAVEPIQRLQLLRHRINEYPLGDLAFHDELARTFNSVRDLHTTYRLPHPYKNTVAWLPFMIEEYWEDGLRKYLVSNIVGNASEKPFEEGVEVLYWNGIPIDRFIHRRALEQAGGNEASRHAQALNSLTFRPLSQGLLPEEEWVSLTFRAHPTEGERTEDVQHTKRFEWLTIEPSAGTVSVNLEVEPTGIINAPMTALGVDSRTFDIQQTKKELYAGESAKQEAESVKLDDQGVLTERVEAFHNTKDGLATYLPTLFRAKPVTVSMDGKEHTYGYVRIFSFNVSSADVFVDEFVRLVEQLPQDGLIIDIRGNGGGLIPAAELLLQVLSPHTIELQRAQFINSPLNLALCEAYSGDEQIVDLSPWTPSIAQSTETGATYSRAFSLTDEFTVRYRTQAYYGPLVLITDALCYSAADMFAAGFQDHALGIVLGTSNATGAGGANVWSHSLLTYLMNAVGHTDYEPLPKGADLRVAIRRTLRTKLNAGEVLEDFGVRPDVVHQMTRSDLIDKNKDLIQRAGEILSGQKAYALHASRTQPDTLTVETHNITRLDVRVDDRVWKTVDIKSDTNELNTAGIDLNGMVDILGYDGDYHVATYRLK